MKPAYEIGEVVFRRLRAFEQMRQQHFDAIQPLLDERVKIRALYSFPIMILPDLTTKEGWAHESWRRYDEYLAGLINARHEDFIQKVHRHFPEQMPTPAGLVYISEIMDPNKWPECGCEPR